MNRFSRPLALAIGYVAAYIVLDWLSYIRPLQSFNITPWNPPPALSIALLLTAGLRYAPLVFVAGVASDHLVRVSTIPPGWALLSSLLLAAGYTGIAWSLKFKLGLKPALPDRRSWASLVAAVVAGASVLAVAYVGTLMAAGVIPAASFLEAALRFWIGDIVGVLLTLPLVLFLCDTGRRRELMRILFGFETLLQGLLIMAALWLVFGFGTANPFKYFYAVFLPLVWVAVRHGAVGAAAAVAVIQIGVMAGVEFAQMKTLTVFELQALLLTLGLTGLLLGITVDEQRSAAKKLSRTVRLAAAGEMAAALAHELNQPLTAIATYGKACQLMASGGAGRRAELNQTLERMLREAKRAGDVVRRLRDFFRTGETRPVHVAIPELLEQLRLSFADRAQRAGLRLEVRGEPDLPPVRVDRLQIEVVLRNLVQNALESVVSSDAAEKAIRIDAAAQGRDRIRISVTDSGPGITPARLETLFEPFFTTKAQGMGMGLPISRAIVEAHGGELTAETGGQGVFHVSLPVAGNDEESE